VRKRRSAPPSGPMQLEKGFTLLTVTLLQCRSIIRKLRVNTFAVSSSYDDKFRNFRKLIFGVRVHLPKVFLNFMHEGHWADVKVTRAKTGRRG